MRSGHNIYLTWKSSNKGKGACNEEGRQVTERYVLTALNSEEMKDDV